MENFAKIFCNLCLDYIENKKFTVINETINEILDILFLKLIKEETKEPLICETCRTKLFKSFRFKTSCVETEDCIVSQGNSENGELVDLRDICQVKRGNGNFRVILENEKICRLCVQIATSGFTPMEDVDIELTHKYIPEVNFKLTKDPVICSACLDSLETHRTFIKDCLKADKETNNIHEDVVKEKQLYIKHEEIEIKSEDNEEASYSSLENVLPTTSKTTDMASRESPRSNHEPCPEAQMGGSSSKRKKISEDSTYKCVPCKYETKNKKYLERHQLKHKVPNYVGLHKCDTCKFETKYKHNLRTHQLIHKDTSEVQLYKCETCSYETRHKGSLVTHQLSHRDVSEVPMYMCPYCDFGTKYKTLLARHQLIHKDVSQVSMYKCDKCNYEAKYKSSLTTHTLTHRDISEVQTYKCDICKYRTKYKSSLTRHFLTHRDISDLPVYRCINCNYRTRYKKNLTQHHLKHRDISEVQMYNCDSCNFQSKYKAHVTRHQLTHENVSVASAQV